MSDGLDLFRERIRKLLEDNRRQAEQARQPFDPSEMLKKLLGMPNQPVQFTPKGIEGVEQFKELPPVEERLPLREGLPTKKKNWWEWLE